MARVFALAFHDQVVHGMMLRWLSTWVFLFGRKVAPSLSNCVSGLLLSSHGALLIRRRLAKRACSFSCVYVVGTKSMMRDERQ